MNVVLGAGMAGLGVYCSKHDVEIFEKEDTYGGLCGNFVIECNGNFIFDKAVHLSFTNDETVRLIFDQNDYITYQPIPYSWYKEQWLQHPAQSNLYPLGIDEKISAIKGFVERPISTNNPDNFEDWTISQYGYYLYENMFKPYNEKYWCTDLKELGVDWLGGRFYLPTIDEVLYGSYTDKTPNTYYAKDMRYPPKGGYKAFLSKLAGDAEENGKIHYHMEAKEIDIGKKIVRFSDGKQIKYSQLYTSIPLPDMFNIIKNVPSELKDMANSLEWTKIALVSIGFDKVFEAKNIWYYIYDRDIMAARAHMPSMKSAYNVPFGCSSIQFEVYFNSKETLMDESKVVNNCIDSLEKMKIATREDILFSDYRVIPNGNVIFKKDTQKTVSLLKEWLIANDIIPIGRFGKWEYLWSDQAFKTGYDASNGL